MTDVEVVLKQIHFKFVCFLFFFLNHLEFIKYMPIEMM